MYGQNNDIHRFHITIMKRYLNQRFQFKLLKETLLLLLTEMKTAAYAVMAARMDGKDPLQKKQNKIIQSLK